MHYEEVQGVWFLLHDVADPVRGDPEDAMGTAAAAAEQHHVLDLHDHGIELGK